MADQYIVTLEQIRTLGRMLQSKNASIIEHDGNTSDGDSKQRKKIYKNRPDGKCRVIQKEESWQVRKSWVRGTNLSHREQE